MDRAALKALFRMFPDDESGRRYLEKRLWTKGTVCPTCYSGDRITSRKGGFYRCNACKKDFTVRTGTIFERSHIPLHKWVYAMYLVVTERNISSLQLSKEISITQKSAWFVLQRLQEACGKQSAIFDRLNKNEDHQNHEQRHTSQKRKKGRQPHISEHSALTKRTRSVHVNN